MNLKQFSEHLRIHVTTARQMVIKGKIEATKTVKGWVITQEQVNNYLKKYE